MLNVGLSKLSSLLVVANLLVVCNGLHLSIVAKRNGKFTYCMSQIVHESCSSCDGHAHLVISISKVSSII